MLDFIQNQIILYVTLVFILFLPGHFLLLAAFGRSGKLKLLERFVISFGLSVLIVDFLMLLLGRLHIAITGPSVAISILALSGACYAIFIKFRNAEVSKEETYDFTPRQTYLIVLILFLTIFIRTLYLGNNALPSSTDLGHHMYWAKQISNTGTLPEYEARDIIESDGRYAISDPSQISDFIIGEHLVFSAVNLVSGADFVSYFPAILLHLINLTGILAIFMLALKFFQDRLGGKNMAILALFFIGPLFAVAPPQAKYVGGGVVGNLLGNLLLPLAFYFYYRALRKKDGRMLAAALVFSMGLFYTHHLTGLLFLLIFSLAILTIAVLHIRELPVILRSWARLVFSTPVVAALIFAAAFVLFIHTPSYLSNRAVSTVLGGPAKIEHGGLNFSQFKFAAGQSRAVFGLSGLAVFALLSFSIFRKKSYAEIFLASWIFFILIISVVPSWLGLSIPSARVANYGAYPLAILGAFAIINLLGWLRNGSQSLSAGKKLFLFASFLLSTFVIISGFYDNSQNLSAKTDAQRTVQTFAASGYLAEKAESGDQILTDHVYVASDAWIKLFFMRDYNFPFYRANFNRYSNGIDKDERCTLWMISTPHTDDAQRCFSELGIDYIMVDKTDVSQFGKDKSLWQVYNNGQIKTYYRPL